ncbi:NfeD family protein [Xanthomonas oryzae]|uniref:NfeD family protein n=1 Tax=Xanthomonas oryzae TaxID=347 RepID=UPI000643C766|nr:NfeD family protein [Xanthomonas oryzae]AKK64817.1 membrane protein [Xanthomonas oryzae pv. oryzicola]MEC5079717.1 NfeD family protein [Xanthomonas oryzae pv. oryzicola]MEC5112530.1 NfeD family protein [Xanthomonas oryzae pv. oryzicola]ULX25590.1 NfeD family protein [Xanthomonas oryzae pv. oryzicola]
MRWDVAVWAVLALLLIAAETLVPGAFLLWMGIAAAAVCVLVLVLPDIALLVQIVAFVVLSFVSVHVYRTWFRGKGRESDRPLLNRRAEQLIGRRVLLDQAIDDGGGRVKVDDAFWVVAGPDLPAGTPVRIVGVDGMTLLVQPVS